MARLVTMTPEEESMHRQVAEARMKELIEYLDILSVEIEGGFVKLNRMWRLLMGVLFVQLIAVALDQATIGALTALLFWITFVYSQFVIDKPLTKALGKFEGCIKTLTILGFIQDADFGSRRKSTKHKVSWYQKMWETIKAKKQSEAYA